MFEDDSPVLFHFQEMALRTSVKHHRQMFAGHVSEVPDINIRLECDEIIEDWDFLENSENEKMVNGNIYSNGSSYVQDREFYDNQPPPNSPVKLRHDTHNQDIFAASNYMQSLFQLWREIGEHCDETDENTQSAFIDSQQSDSQILSGTESTQNEADHNLQTTSTAPCKVNAARRNDSFSGLDVAEADQNINVDENDIEDTSDHLDHTNSDPESSSQDECSDDEHITWPPYERDQDSHTESARAGRILTPVPEEGLPDAVGWNNQDRVHSPTLEEIHADMMNLRHYRSSSPSAELQEIDGNISDLPLEDGVYMYSYMDDRFSAGRMSGRWSNNDHEVPDIEMAIDSDSETYGEFTSLAIRSANSCNDQVVPSFIEE